jgi:hypothetical protein
MHAEDDSTKRRVNEMPIIKEVRDRKLPPNLDPECKRSQAQGSSGMRP